MVITDNFFLTAGDLTELTVVVFYLFHLFKVLVLCTYYLQKTIWTNGGHCSHFGTHFHLNTQSTHAVLKKQVELRSSSSRWNHLYSK